MTTNEIRALLTEAERELADGTVTTDIEPLLVEVGPLCDRLDAITSDRDDFSVAMSDLEEDNTTLRDGRDLATQTRDEAQKRSNIDLDRARKAETQRDDAQARCLRAQQIAMECQTEKLAAQVLRAHVKLLREALERVQRIPSKPFPDRGAHSERAFSGAVWQAWRDIQLLTTATLRVTKEDE